MEPAPPRGRPSDGKTAARFVLTAYDFSRAYDVIDHQMLRLKMSRHLPRCVPPGSTTSSVTAGRAPKSTAYAVTAARSAPAFPRVVVCSDSQAALATLASGAGAQTTALGAALWDLLLELSAGGRLGAPAAGPRTLWAPGNETADRLAKEASSLPQDDVHVDVHTITRAVGRSASKAWRRSWNDSLFRRIMEDRMPSPVQESRDDAVNVHQLRSGHWGRASSYLHRIGRNPSHACRQCSVPRCPAALCLVCREGPDTPEHVLHAWLAYASVFSAISGLRRRSCGTAGPWRP